MEGSCRCGCGLEFGPVVQAYHGDRFGSAGLGVFQNPLQMVLDGVADFATSGSRVMGDLVAIVQCENGKRLFLDDHSAHMGVSRSLGYVAVLQGNDGASMVPSFCDLGCIPRVDDRWLFDDSESAMHPAIQTGLFGFLCAGTGVCAPRLLFTLV